MRNMYKEYIKRKRNKKAVIKWNNDLPEINKKIKNEDDYFKWNQLVWQEIWMFISLAEQVTEDDFLWICDRRGFTKDMANYLKEMLIHVGIGKSLKGVCYEKKR